ncbi:Hypothetical protein D9617_44g039050 [Elsinoe fawcettii]|nr:Hypothetical protein D9617_44g039050 [Elsinoe fawcettii]
MAQSSLKVMRGVLSATSEYIPDGAAKQAKLFITEQVSAVVGAIANCARSNLSTTASALLAATGLSVRAAPAIVSAPALVMSGFGSTGVGAAQETIENRIEVQIVDAATLERVLTYLYTGTYNDASVHMSDSKELPRDSRHGGAILELPEKVNIPIIHAEAREVNVGSEDEVGPESARSVLEVQNVESHSVWSALEASESNSSIRNGGKTEKEDHQPDGPTDDAAKSDFDSERLENNAFVYILADYCHIPDLMRLAVTKFRVALGTGYKKNLAG